MKIPMPRSAPVVLVAAGCLLLGSTGGAVAGAMITGKQIKDNTVTTKDIKNGSLAVKDLSKKSRNALAGGVGPAGPAGATGPAGARGFSAWDTIPSGVTVTGRFYRNEPTNTTIGWVAENVNFPAKAPAVPTGYGFGPDSLGFTTTDPDCTGTFAAPTAPAGHVCVYMGGVDNVDGAGVSDWSGAEQNAHTFYMTFHQTTPDSDYEFWGNWAYTAP